MANVLSSNGMAMLDRYLTDAAFRAAVKTDPLGAAAAAGFNLTKAEKASLKKTNQTWNAKNLSDADRMAVTSGMKTAQPLALFW